MSRPNRFVSLRLTISLAVLMASAACASAQVGPTQMVHQSLDANPPVAFAQIQSDLPVDPAARFGTLPNGMGYVIYRNSTPPGTASVWMRVGAGSVMEQENQRGLAHFIEHMAFQGSRNVPEGEMVRLLERDGLKFGADTNASTSFFETVYTLNLPVADDRIVDQALFLMRETAGNLLFDPEAIDRERGVILSEERARATVGARASEAEMKRLFPGAKYPERIPIGLTEVIRNAQRPEFVQFYDDFYRPEYTTLIVAGDIDPETIEREIQVKFGDWRPGPQSPAARTDYGVVEHRAEPEAEVFTADGLTDSISLAWVVPPVDVAETRTKSFDDTVFSLATALLNERFGRQAQAAGTAFLSAGFQREQIEHTAQVDVLTLFPKPGQDRAAFEQAVAMLRDYVAHGPTQEELNRILAVAGQVTRQRAAAERTRPTQEIAARILEAVGSESVLQSPTQTFAEFEAWTSRLTLDSVSAAIRKIDLTVSPLLWLQGEAWREFNQAAMIDSYRNAMHAPVNAAGARQALAWPYTTFGPPTAVTSRESVAGADATRITFANGVVLNVKPTTLEDDTVYVIVRMGDGLMSIGPSQGPTLFMARQVGLSGGLGRLRSEDIQEALAGKAYGLGFNIGDDAISLSGRTTPTDLAVQMQVLGAYITDSAFRADVLDRIKAGLPAGYNQARTSPDGVYALEAQGDLYGGDARFATPPMQEAMAVDNDSITALMKDQLGHGPVEVTIVGDIGVDEAVRQVAATLGALPALPSAVDTPDADRLRFPTTERRRIYTHDGRSDQNLSVIAWPTQDYYADPRRAAALDLLAAVMTNRELDQIREEQGATYTVTARNTSSTAFPGFGFLITRASVRPEFDQSFYDTVSGIVDELKSRPVTADELVRARQPLMDGLRNARNSNAYWLGLLSGSAHNVRQIEAVQMRERNLSAVTVQDLQTLAQDYLDMSKALRVQVKPVLPT